MTELKPGWQRVKFGEVVRLNKETCKDPEAAGIERVIGLENLEPDGEVARPRHQRIARQRRSKL